MLVSDDEQLSICEQAGGEYMITPNVNTSLIRECVRRGLVAMPGAITPSEAVAAYDAGASFVKIFPAGSLGPGYIKVICAPLSHIPFLAVGGIGPDNVAGFIKAGCVGAGTGLVFLLRWFWMRINAWTEIVAMLVSFLCAVFFQFVWPHVSTTPLHFWQKLLLTIAATTAAWLAVTFATSPEADETIVRFRRRVRADGRDVGKGVLMTFLCSLGIFACMALVAKIVRL